MKTKIIISITVLVVVLGLIWYGTKMAEAPTDLPAHTFTADSGNSIDVRFDNEKRTAIMTGAGYENLMFEQAMSASGARYVNQDNNLVLWNKGDDITLSEDDEVIFEGSTAPANNQPSSSLEGTSWSWVQTELLSGETVSAPAGDRFVITFEAGTLGSTTDCNSMGGSYVVDGEILSIGELMMTKMYCEGSMEAVYAEHLGLVNSYVIVGDTLRFNLNRDYGTMVFKKTN